MKQPTDRVKRIWNRTAVAWAMGCLLVGGATWMLRADPGSPPDVAADARNLSASEICRELTDNSVAGFSRRLGPDYAFYHQSQSTPLPQVYLVPPKERPKKSGPVRYQYGGPWTPSSGDFSSTQGQVLYADAHGVNVDRVTIIEWSHNCFTESPEPPWHGGFRPEPSTRSWLKLAPAEQWGVPIAEARGMGGWSNCGVVLFSSGTLATACTVTAWGTDPYLVLPRGKIPTAISLTNKNEFALVTLVDPASGKGQVAVIAMESSGKPTGFAHEWPEAYPGLPNVAVFTNMKLLGCIDLPGMSYPTSVSAVGSKTANRLNGHNGNAGLLREYDLSKQSDRNAFYGKGHNAGYVSSCGFAVVASKYENKVAFIDLQPLFEVMREAYFTTQQNYEKTRNLGPAPNQWPYTFEYIPKWKPPVVKVVDVREPTAVLASLAGGDDACASVASRDGRVTIFSVGGLGTDKPVNPSAIAPMAEVRVGRNPVWLAYQKGRDRDFIAVCRGDRCLDWVQFDKDGVRVTKRLQDARLIDPVYAETADTHGVEASILTVADFAGRKILNYRYSQLVFATQGGAKFGIGAGGKEEFECGGYMELPGSPFCVTATNVN